MRRTLARSSICVNPKEASMTEHPTKPDARIGDLARYPAETAASRHPATHAGQDQAPCLYLLVRWLRRPNERPLAEVENCRSLERVLLSPEDLARLSVRVISKPERPRPTDAR
jgi:hypothetical protein